MRFVYSRDITAVDEMLARADTASRSWCCVTSCSVRRPHPRRPRRSDGRSDGGTVSPTALLIGMVGQFRAQKAYTRAVRVLSRVREHGRRA